MGPTPPGTGEIALTFFDTESKSTSPTACPSIKVQPTSIMIDLSDTIEVLIKFGFPIADIMISAPRVCSMRFSVLLLQQTTVAHLFISMSDMGFPTIFDRPSTTIFFPRISIL